MKIVEFKSIFGFDFSLKHIYAVFQEPVWRKLKSENRSSNGFIIVNSGSCRYLWEGGEAMLSRGMMIYLPTHSVHSIDSVSNDFSFYRIDFTLVDNSDNEEVVFSQIPLIVKSINSNELEQAQDILKYYAAIDCSIELQSCLLSLFLGIKRSISGGKSSRIAPAIEYINMHFNEEFSITQLAEMCYITETHLHRLFKSELNMTPTEYKNDKRIKTACVFLKDGDYSVSEISEMVGFESIYYFSRVFKSIIGVSPIKYKTTHK